MVTASQPLNDPETTYSEIGGLLYLVLVALPTGSHSLVHCMDTHIKTVDINVRSIISRGITNNVVYLSRFQKHNYDLLYTQSLFIILPHITKVI